jgi:hypothetical protein
MLLSARVWSKPWYGLRKFDWTNTAESLLLLKKKQNHCFRMSKQFRSTGCCPVPELYPGLLVVLLRICNYYKLFSFISVCCCIKISVLYDCYDEVFPFNTHWITFQFSEILHWIVLFSSAGNLEKWTSANKYYMQFFMCAYSAIFFVRAA